MEVSTRTSTAKIVHLDTHLCIIKSITVLVVTLPHPEHSCVVRECGLLFQEERGLCTDNCLKAFKTMTLCDSQELMIC